MLDFPILRYNKAILETLGELIAYPTMKGEGQLNMPYGKHVFRALLYLLDKAERMDLETLNMFGHMGCVSYGSGEETVAILCHIDVVPPGDGWNTDPFHAEIKDGRIYGRGAVDNKGPAVAALYALAALKENCVTLNKKVMVIFGCDEESGWADIDFYKAHYPEPDYVITPDAFFPIVNREKGLLHMRLSAPAGDAPGSAPTIRSIRAGSRPNIVPNHAECTLGRAPVEVISRMAQLADEKMPAQLSVVPEGENACRIVCQGKAAHGSHPEEGVNALAYLIAFLNTLPLADGPAERFVYALAERIGTEYDGAMLGIAAEDAYCGPLTVNLGAIEMEGGEISAKVDIRFPMSLEMEDVYEKAAACFAEKGIAAGKLHAQPPHYVPEDSELVAALQEVYAECFGEEARCMPCAGATYARAFKNSVAFGPVPAERPSVEHGPNEYIEIDDLVKLAEALACAIVRLAAAPEENQEIFLS